MLERIIGILKLDIPTYEDIEHDESAIGQAAMVVFAVAIFAAIGGYLAGGSLNSMMDSLGDSGLGSFAQTSLSPTGLAISGFLNVFISWGLWSFVSFFVATKFFGGDATPGEMARVLGFAQAPRLLGVIPCLGGVVGTIWAWVCGFIAVRQGADIDNGKTVATVVITIILVGIARWAINAVLMGIGLV
ncbi:MAG TPA: hypothetical protein ENJ56_06160 [Anaerolineae bacterium]|nr:hypothetical protein [Anaerolineae bacterium]